MKQLGYTNNRIAETRQLNIQQTEIIAVGNANIDLSMVQYAGLGVWLDNVSPELRNLLPMQLSSLPRHHYE